MNKRTRNIILLTIFMAISALLALIAIIRVPSYVTERMRLKALQARLDNQIAVETQLKVFQDSFRQSTVSLRESIEARLKQIENASFTCRPESEISLFVEELQAIFSVNGVKIDNLAYKTRQTTVKLVTLPFETSLTCSYAGLRKLLHAIESNPAGISIDQIEFLQLDNKGQGASVKIAGSVRFKKVGS